MYYSKSEFVRKFCVAILFQRCDPHKQETLAKLIKVNYSDNQLLLCRSWVCTANAIKSKLIYSQSFV